MSLLLTLKEWHLQRFIRSIQPSISILALNLVRLHVMSHFSLSFLILGFLSLKIQNSGPQSPVAPNSIQEEKPTWSRL